MQLRTFYVILAASALCGVPTVRPARAETHSRTSAKAQEFPPDQRVDINHATLGQLLAVPGMTRTWAGRIMRFRPYRAKTDLVQHGVVTAEVYARIEDGIIAHRHPQ
ncbi:MAG TPA: helix-hairpin-helix domain-containing protein [Terracidiphilus sp.]|nr:helix-hairpin-helix domain-containing protein [Terracidiphilus sp.]